MILVSNQTLYGMGNQPPISSSTNPIMIVYLPIPRLYCHPILRQPTGQQYPNASSILLIYPKINNPLLTPNCMSLLDPYDRLYCVPTKVRIYSIIISFIIVIKIGCHVPVVYYYRWRLGYKLKMCCFTNDTRQSFSIDYSIY